MWPFRRRRKREPAPFYSKREYLRETRDGCIQGCATPVLLVGLLALGAARHISRGRRRVRP